MSEIFLNSLKKLLDEIGRGELTNINARLSSCWEELSLMERDNSIPPEVIRNNKKIMQELTSILREYEGKPPSEESLHQIRTKIFGWRTKQEHLEEDISDMINLLKEIERKMKKEKNQDK
ncbi:MAG: hypothetical protein QW279_07830 [Candidatus Jordarchaeaceae archaeon]